MSELDAQLAAARKAVDILNRAVQLRDAKAELDAKVEALAADIVEANKDATVDFAAVRDAAMAVAKGEVSSKADEVIVPAEPVAEGVV